MESNLEHSGHQNAAHTHEMNLTDCNGVVYPMGISGTFAGHVVPGSLFIIWGCWWTIAIVANYLTASHKTTAFRSKAWFPLHIRGLYYTEPILKVLFPLFALSVELYFDHPDGFQFMHCPAGTANAGKFAEMNMNNWQHAASYPAVILSGMVDLLGSVVPLPSNASQGVLSLALSLMAFLMSVHEKHQPLDKMIHWLLFVTMSLAALTLWIDLRYQHNVVVSLGRSAALIFLGAWMVQVGSIEYHGGAAFEPGEMAGPMLAPVYFVFIAVAIIAAVTITYVGFYVLFNHSMVARRVIVKTLASSDSDDGSGGRYNVGPRVTVADEGSEEYFNKRPFVYSQLEMAARPTEHNNNVDDGSRSSSSSSHDGGEFEFNFHGDSANDSPRLTPRRGDKAFSVAVENA